MKKKVINKLLVGALTVAMLTQVAAPTLVVAAEEKTAVESVEDDIEGVSESTSVLDAEGKKSAEEVISEGEEEQPVEGQEATSEEEEEQEEEQEVTSEEEEEQPEEQEATSEEDGEQEEQEVVPEEEQLEEVQFLSLYEEEVTAEPILQNGEVILHADYSDKKIKDILGHALIENADQVDLQSLEWEYYCTGKNGPFNNDAWGNIFGFTSSKKVGILTKEYSHPALAKNDDKVYKIRLKGTTTEVTVNKAAKLQSVLTLNEGVQMRLVYNEDTSVNYEAVEKMVFEQLIASSTPELSQGDVTIEYYATATTGAVGSIGKAWAPLKGGKVSGLSYPAMTIGTQKIRISFDGDDTYKNVSAEAYVVFTDRESAVITLNQDCKVKLPYDENVNIDFAALKEAIFTNMVAETTPELSQEDVTIEYYATATTGAIGSLGKAWVPLEGGKESGLTYPAIPEGTQKIRISFAGNTEYKGTSAEGTLQVIGIPELEVTLHEGPYEVGMVFTEDQGYNYEATKYAIYEAVIEATNPEIAPEDVKVEYDASVSGLVPVYKPLDTTDWSVKNFGEGTWNIRFSWNGTREYKAGSIVEKVTMVDNRIASVIVFNDNASFTYNMDAAVMKQAILDQVIDWTNSTLPARETLTVDNFKMEYYGNSVLPGNISGNPGWAPIEGSDSVLVSYPSMGAGEQNIRISYKGNADYRPSDVTETTITVNKANVSVKVKSLSIFPEEAVPADMVTTNPADKFDIYTVYAGVTRNATSIVYLELPERFTNENVLKILNPVVKAIYGKSFTDILRDGMTIGELKEMLSAKEIIDLLEKLNIDTGTFGQIIKVIDQLPSVADSVRVAFGTPNKAGTYAVTAITDNPNYNTGVGIGALLVKAHYTDVKLKWNQQIPNRKLTAKEAANFDFGVTLTYKGDSNISQENVHYLYSGMTSKFRVYSSTTTPPTEPGSYVVTVVTLGGNYQAAPITRSFKITK